MASADPAWFDKATRVHAMFSDIAPRYDLLNRLLSFGLDGRWRDQAAEVALAGGAQRVLDVATGTGELALALARRADGAEVIGLDFADPMLERARAKAARRGLRLRFLSGDGANLPFQDGSLGAVTIAYGLRNFADIDGGLREFHRVLRPGGRLVVLEFPPPPAGPFGALFRAYFQHLLPWIGGAVSGRPSAYRYLPASVLAFPAPDALAGRMRAAGFGPVSYRLQTFGVSALHIGERIA